MKLKRNIWDITNRRCNLCGSYVSDRVSVCMDCGNIFVQGANHKLSREDKEVFAVYTNTFGLKFPFSDRKDLFDYGEVLTKKWLINNVEDDWVIFDCGANIGVFTAFFTILASEGEVFAFEPGHTFKFLEKNMNHFLDSGILPRLPVMENLALGKETGTFQEKLWVVWKEKLLQGRFDFVNIDDYVKKKNISRLDLLKIDVDGFDVEVLFGAKETLDRFSPVVLIEYSDITLEKRGYSKEDIDAFLKKKGYRMKEYFIKEGNRIYLKPNKP